MNFRVVIPARYASSRFPGKVLAKLCGKPLVWHVWQSAMKSQASEVLIATDSETVLHACKSLGMDVHLTSNAHQSGTDRIAELALRFDWDEEEIIVNLQGDEPLMPSAVIDQVAHHLDGDALADMATLATPIHDLQNFLDPNVVKVVTDINGRALYFSRAPIPWSREGAPGGYTSQAFFNEALRHIGLYAYRTRALKKLVAMQQCEIERIEKLEQLRALWHGMTLLVDIARVVPGPSVDTPEELDQAARIISAGMESN